MARQSKLRMMGCMYCSFTTYASDQLAKHFLKDHQDKRMSAQPPQPQEEDGFSCFCGKVFKHRSGLERHSISRHQKPLL